MSSDLKQFVRKYVRKRPIVVAALQSPHLLNIWQKSSKWHLYYDLLGDHEGLEESKELEVPRITPEYNEKVAAVLVTTPAQLEQASEKYPEAKKYWVVHTGYFLEVLPSEHVKDIDGIITLTKSVRDIQLAHKQDLDEKNNFVITPYFTANPIWNWTPGVLWTIRSRAGTRMAPSKHRFDAVIKGVKTAIKDKTTQKLFFFGQGSPDGYIDAARKKEFFRSCSGYISALPVDAGFGLAEHEAMAHGVPIIGSRWGDIDGEIALDYPSLLASEDEMINAACDLMIDEAKAALASRRGLEYIRTHRTKRAMNRQVRNMALHLQGQPLLLI